jgi:hypothetical protein
MKRDENFVLHNMRSVRHEAVSTPMKDTFTIKPNSSKRIVKWLQQIAVNFLTNTGAAQQYFKWDVPETIETLVITHQDREAITKRIIDEMNRMDIERIGPDTHVIVMGFNEFDEIMKKPRSSQWQTPMYFKPFNVDSTTIQSNDPYHGRRMWNWPIHVTPYVSGIAIFPKAIVELKKVTY